MPPFLILAAVAASAVYGAKAVKREWRRVNRELERAEAAESERPSDLPKLKRDPQSGEWRLS